MGLHAGAGVVLLTCEQVILICSFSSHSFKKSIMTCFQVMDLAQEVL